MAPDNKEQPTILCAETVHFALPEGCDRNPLFSGNTDTRSRLLLPKIYSSEYMKSSSKGQRWITAFAMIAFLLAFPVAELIMMGKWNERSYTQSQLSYLYSSLWSSDFLTMGAAVAAVTAFLAANSMITYGTR